MTITLPDWRGLVVSLDSDLCPMCGGTKQPSHTMCGRDYHRLGSRLQRNLYNGIGDGYEEAVREAMVSLGKSKFLMPTSANMETEKGDLA